MAAKKLNKNPSLDLYMFRTQNEEENHFIIQFKNLTISGPFLTFGYYILKITLGPF